MRRPLLERVWVDTLAGVLHEVEIEMLAVGHWSREGETGRVLAEKFDAVAAVGFAVSGLRDEVVVVAAAAKTKASDVEIERVVADFAVEEEEIDVLEAPAAGFSAAGNVLQDASCGGHCCLDPAGGLPLEKEQL
jgi:hypothetical protein